MVVFLKMWIMTYSKTISIIWQILYQIWENCYLKWIELIKMFSFVIKIFLMIMEQLIKVNMKIFLKQL